MPVNVDPIQMTGHVPDVIYLVMINVHYGIRLATYNATQWVRRISECAWLEHSKELHTTMHCEAMYQLISTRDCVLEILRESLNARQKITTKTKQNKKNPPLTTTTKKSLFMVSPILFSILWQFTRCRTVYGSMAVMAELLIGHSNWWIIQIRTI